MFIDNVSSYHEYSLDTRNDELRFLFTENITKYEGEISMCGFLFASEEKVGIEMFKKGYDNVFHSSIAPASIRC